VDRSFADLLAAHYRRLHDRVLVLIDDLGSQQLDWRAGPTDRSIADRIVDLTRSSCELQRRLSAGTSASDGLLGQRRRGLVADTPTRRDDRVARPAGAEESPSPLAPPEKEVLLDDARQTFAAMERLFAVALIDPDGPSVLPIGMSDALISHLTAAHQQLGQIACLHELQAYAVTPGPGRDAPADRRQTPDQH